MCQNFTILFTPILISPNVTYGLKVYFYQHTQNISFKKECNVEKDGCLLKRNCIFLVKTEDMKLGGV